MEWQALDTAMKRVITASVSEEEAQGIIAMRVMSHYRDKEPDTNLEGIEKNGNEYLVRIRVPVDSTISDSERETHQSHTNTPINPK